MIERTGGAPDPAGRTRPPHLQSGHLFWMPAGSTWLNRHKPRPFVLATPCRRGVAGTLLYGSTQLTEKQFGAACIAVEPIRAGIHRNHLRARTYFYPGILLLIWYESLPPHSGFLKPVDALKRELRKALGIGQGPCTRPTSPPASRRGRIVVLGRDVAADFRTPFAVLLTEAQYSVTRHYQIILPILPGNDGMVDEHDLRISSRPWLAVFADPVRSVLLPIPITQSVRHADDIAYETEYVLDAASLRQIDERLCSYFSL